jgi:hypothetical protein
MGGLISSSTHGWQNNVEVVLRQYGLIEQLRESRRNAVLVVPQGPRNAPDSFGGKLEDADGFKRLVADVIETLKQKSALQQKDFAIGQIVFSHSGGYDDLCDRRSRWLMTKCARCGFDALYAQTAVLAWIDRPGPVHRHYTERGGTKAKTEQLMATLRQWHSLLAARSQANPASNE